MFGGVMIKEIDKYDLKEAITKFYLWQHGNGHDTSFESLLYTLFQKADAVNKRRLSMAFPYEAGNFGNNLFKEYGILK